MWRDLISRDAKFSLDDALDFAHSDYRTDFHRHWGLDAAAPPEWLELEEWLDFKRIYGFAREVASRATTLLRRKGVGPGRLQEGDLMREEAETFDTKVKALLDQIADQQTRWKVAQLLESPTAPSDPRTKYWVFHNTLQLEAAEFLPYSPARLADRFRPLIKYLVETHNPRAVEYLARVSRCYLLDLAPEFAVMARAVLDVSLQDLLPDEVVRARVGADRHVTLDDRLRCCEAIGILGGSASRGARMIQKVGGDAAHGRFDETIPLEPLLEALHEVFGQLVRYQQPAP